MDDCGLRCTPVLRIRGTLDAQAEIGLMGVCGDRFNLNLKVADRNTELNEFFVESGITQKILRRCVPAA